VKAIDPRVTFAELQRWSDDGRRYELYNGEVIVANTLEIYALRGSVYELARTYGSDDEASSPTLPGLTFKAARAFAP